MIVNIRYDNSTVIGLKKKESLEMHTDVWVVLKYSGGGKKSL